MWRNLPKPLKISLSPEELSINHENCRLDFCDCVPKLIQFRFPEENFCPKFRAPAWRGSTTFHQTTIHPRYHQKSVSLLRHISHFEGVGRLRKLPLVVFPTAFDKVHKKVKPFRQLPDDFESRQPTKWERGLCNKSIERELRLKESPPVYQRVPDVFDPPPSLVRPSCLRQVLTASSSRVVWTYCESDRGNTPDSNVDSVLEGLSVRKRLTDLKISPEIDIPEEHSINEESSTKDGSAESEATPPLGFDGTGDQQSSTLSQVIPQKIPAGPWSGLQSSFENYSTFNNSAFGSQYQEGSKDTWAELDRLKDYGQRLLRKSHSLGLDGTSDRSESEHPNLASFSFSFPAPAEPRSPGRCEVERSERIATGAGPDGTKQTTGQSQLASSPLPRPRDSAPPTSSNLPSPARKEFKVPVPTEQVASSVDVQGPSRHKPGSTSAEQPTPTTPSPVRDENSKPRSLRRVIRADDSWQVGRKTPQTAFRVKTRQDPPPRSTPLELPKVKEVASERSTEFQKPFQTLQTPERPTAKELLAQEFSDEELKPEPLSIRKRRSPSAEELEPPRLTRELVLRHLASDESLRDRAKQPASDTDSTDFELLRRIKKARRGGVIFERLESDSEDEVKLEKKLQEEIVLMADLLHPESATAMTEHRREAVRLAKSQESSVVEKCKRSNQQMPDYSFEELIGKGSYGRVYKGRHTTSKKIVAIKVIDIDEADFHSAFEQKDEQIKDFNREIRILKQAQDSGAPNMNLMIEALPVHSQLWLVCEYCPGGSVKTLMRATNDRLSEQYIIVVARELAKALAGLHDAGIMHRDIKAANVLIHEEGRLELCDFGVATVLDTKSDKRKTFIGTPHWMPPELFVENPEYSDEVDVWEYGCTLYECALGKPPHSDLRERQQLASRMRRLKQSITLPEHEEFSDGLRDLVAYTLSPDAKMRPSMRQVLTHKHLLNTEIEYPTTSLSELVKVYYAWLYSGGQRASLFMPGGAVVSDHPGSITTPIDEWNFSTTEVFEKRISAVMDIPDFTQMSTLNDNEGDATPRGPRDAGIASPPLKEMTNVQKANFEARVQRGEGLVNLFDQAKPDYEYKTKTDFRPLAEERRVSDLPFRAMAEDRPSSIASNVIDLGDFDSEDYAIAAPMKEETTIQLADAATIRAKRSDSKGPARDTSTTRKASLTEDISATVQENSRRSAQDFAFPPKEWTLNDDSGARGIEENDTSELTPNKDEGRKTMDWTFASAFPTSADEDDEPQPVVSQQNKAKKHATLEWSFSNAMAEADTGSDDDAVPNTSMRVTPKRPTPLLRTMTQPVTSNEVHTAEEFPRPSTAMSEAYSESSMSSADFDPFALEGNQELPVPMAQAMDDMGVSSYYSKNSGLDFEHTVPYSSTVAGPAPYMLGAPARIGEPEFPGPQTGIVPSSLTQSDKGRKQQDSSGRSSSGRPRVELPDAVPPSLEALALDAPAEVVENELSRLLGGLQASLAGAGQALQMMRRPRKNKEKRTPRGRTRPSSSEWEDEE